MNEKTKRFSALLTLLLFSLFLYVTPLPVSASTSTTTLAFPSTVKWMLRNYNTTIGFSQTVYCSTFGYEGGVWSNSKWFWHNLRMDGDTVSYFWVSSTTANITFTSFFKNNKIVLTVTGQTGVSTTIQMYIPTDAEPDSVEGASSWSFNKNTKTLTFTVVPSSTVTVTIYLNPVKKWFDEASRLFGQFFVLFTLIASIRVVKGVSDWIGGRKKPKDVFGESFTKTIMWKIIETALVTATVVLLLNVVAGMF